MTPARESTHEYFDSIHDNVCSCDRCTPGHGPLRAALWLIIGMPVLAFGLMLVSRWAR